MAHLTPDGRHLLVTDLGTDQLTVYQINPQGNWLLKDRCHHCQLVQGSPFDVQ